MTISFHSLYSPRLAGVILVPKGKRNNNWVGGRVEKQLQIEKNDSIKEDFKKGNVCSKYLRKKSKPKILFLFLKLKCRQ